MKIEGIETRNGRIVAIPKNINSKTTKSINLNKIISIRMLIAIIIFFIISYAKWTQIPIYYFIQNILKNEIHFKLPLMVKEWATSKIGQNQNSQEKSTIHDNEWKLDYSEKIKVENKFSQKIDESWTYVEPEEKKSNKSKLPANGYISSNFGYRIHPIKKSKEFHKGIDIGANQGEAVFAMSRGTVLESSFESSYGNYIRIKGTTGEITTYAHCSKLIAKKGKKIAKGDIIALIGNTGSSIGPHLHFEVQKDGKLINPVTWLNDIS